MRCINECKERIYPLPLNILPRDKDQGLSSEDKKLLSCPDCGAGTRPHVLWFDETYNEHYFKFDSTMTVAENTDILIIAGTSGATTLPNHIANIVYQNKGTIIDINIEQNPFTALAMISVNGDFLNMTCSEGLTRILMMMEN
ncbi:MAG: hypothetical protein O7D86_06405 [Proteobacteria bacterium]|nr:hypothetical protein [Pseudomonadota bacterium]